MLHGYGSCLHLSSTLNSPYVAKTESKQATHKYTSRTRELKTPGGREKKADQNFLRYRYFSRKEKKRERGGEVIDRRGRRGKKGKATSYFVHGYPIKSE